MEDKTNLLLDGVLEGKKTRAVRESVVGSSGLGVTSLVQELEVARVDGEGLVGVGADEITVGDVVGPGGARVCLAGEGSALRGGLRGPGAAEGGGGEGAEVAAAGTLGLDDHEVLGLALEGVDLDSLEEVVGGVAHDDGRGGAEAAGEVANGHAGAVDLAVVAGEEQVHVLAVTDDGLIDRTSAGTRDGTSEQRLSSRPAVGVAGVLRCAVREGGGSPLVGKDPDVLGSEVEESRSNSRLGQLVLGGAAHLGPVTEQTEVHTTVVGAVMVRSVDDVLTVVVGGGQILDGDPAVLGLSEGTGGRPLGLGRNVTGLSRDGAEKHGGRHQAGLSNGELHFEEVVRKVVSECKSWWMADEKYSAVAGRFYILYLSMLRVSSGEYGLPISAVDH
jgi:hypothetical protein